MIAKLPGSAAYDGFAYDVTLLKEFLREEEGGENLTSSMRSGGGRKKRLGSGMNNNGSLRSSVKMGGSFRGGSRFARKFVMDGDDSIHSAGSLRGRRNFARSASVSK